MCVVSFVGDHYRDRWTVPPGTAVPLPVPYRPPLESPPVTREEFERLRADVLEMKELLRKASS